ncbi:hypothetical protein BJX99DRAFT_260213 [Aspergillus californicus]
MVHFFASFSLLTRHEYLLGAEQECVAYVGSPKKPRRCKGGVPNLNFSEILRLRAEHDEAVDTERTKILIEIADLCVCRLHDKGDKSRTTAAAAQQWENDIQHPDSERRFDELKLLHTPTPPRGPLNLTFKKYGTDGTEKDAEEDMSPERALEEALEQKMHDDKQREKADQKADCNIVKMIASPGKAGEGRRNPSNYLYVFGHEKAKDMFKIGYAVALSRIQQQDKCYPGLTTYCFIFCPNAPMVEKLVHAEFSAERYWHACDVKRCKDKKHTEWFKAPLQEILDTVTTLSFWSQMFYNGGVSVNRSILPIMVPGATVERFRWRDWAQDQMDEWKRQAGGSEIPGPVQVPENVEDSEPSEAVSEPIPQPPVPKQPSRQEQDTASAQTPFRRPGSYRSYDDDISESESDTYYTPPGLSHSVETTPGSPIGNNDPFSRIRPGSSQVDLGVETRADPEIMSDGALSDIFEYRLNIASENLKSDTKSKTAGIPFDDGEAPPSPTPAASKINGPRLPLRPKNANEKFPRRKPPV